MTAPHALIISATGFQDHELVYPYYRLKGAGFVVSVIADTRDERGRFYGYFGLNMPCDVLFDDLPNVASDFLDTCSLLVIPGGVKAMEKIRMEDAVVQFVTDWDEKSKVIASTCSGAQLLISANVVAGRQISGYYSMRQDIVNAGATFVDEPAVVSDNIVSSPHYDHMGEWMEATLSLHAQFNQ